MNYLNMAVKTRCKTKCALNSFNLLLLVLLFNTIHLKGQDGKGYNLWLGYEKVQESTLQVEYEQVFESIYIEEGSGILKRAKNEISLGVERLLGKKANFSTDGETTNTILVAKKSDLQEKGVVVSTINFEVLGKEGFVIKSIRSNNKNILVLTANEDIGILYGVFRLLHLMKTHKSIVNISLSDAPKIDVRMLNHWDNLDRSVERGFAGASIWNWHKLPKYIDKRYIDYARANASIGINAVSLTNVNANALVLTPMYLEKVKALADVFKDYGIKVYLTARFSAPIEIGKLETADPLNESVQSWWNEKVTEIYGYIPNFGGFLVKANSEGQPGPQNYGRNHVDGANMMANALAPHNGLVIWRAFVYSEHSDVDRAKQAYSEFVPYDGKFKDNVLVQVKNGAIDFQPQEPFHPMFGAMPKTPLMMEFQITQEYLGFSTHLVFLPKLFEEVLDADTYRKGKGSSVAKVIDGSLHNNKISGMAGVANIGSDLNWTGHVFAQANWYGFGRLAWDPYLSSEIIAEEWIRATFSNDPKFIEPVEKMLLDSREAVVNYMNPLGLHHIFDTGHHYGPGPWVSNLSRPEWNPVYYHQADSLGIGFDRTASGSNAVEQYAPEVSAIFSNLENCSEKDLLWFHHLSWDYKLKNGQTLWNGIGMKYQEGVDSVKTMISTWQAMKPYIDAERHTNVTMLLEIQLTEAKWWRDACMLYFQTFSKMDFPKEMGEPEKSLEYYRSLKFPFAPGIRPRWN